jgi:hypothetical protein
LFDERESGNAGNCGFGLDLQGFTPSKPMAEKCPPYKSYSTSTRARIFQRGGARPRLDKISNALTVKQVEQITQAIIAAHAIDQPFNRFITIHWERAGLTGHIAARATSRFLKLARDNMAGKGLPFAYVWIRENDKGDGNKGDHVHILAHIPKGQSLGRWQRRWIGSISGKAYRKDVILTRMIARHSEAVHTMPKLYQLNLAILRDYVLKGASFDAAKALALPSWQLGGRVTGQRMGMSKNLSRKIRG